MDTKTIYMNGGDNGSEVGYIDGTGYIYPNSDDDQPNCGETQCSDQEQVEYGEEEYPEFYENLEVISEHKPNNNQNQNQTSSKLKTKPRSMSFDSEGSDISKRPNFKCGSCKKSFLLDKNQKMIRCTFCGYRILFKLRTRSYITYKTE